ncbi:MAG: serine/threonine protein kinase, partial [Pirellula sp.]|nr:serine/threonine protein kinase [Pirellula sp.]
LESALRSDAADSECEDSESKESVCQRLTALLGPTDDPSMLGRIGAYEIIGLLGYGGMGAVFKGLDRSLNRFVAIKMLLPHLAASGAARKRFAREAKAVAAVVDDHVMAIHCVDEWHGVPYLVMTYSRGITLQNRLCDNGPLDVREILRVGMQTAKGLAAAHAQGIVHRDIKPANIFLDQNVERVQLMDFGLARAVDDASLTRTGVLAGTPQYMSPEQARAETVDQRSDLFSLGCVMYAMCTGHPPFRAESSYAVLRLITDKEPRSIREINPDVPEWLCSIIAKLMAKQACDRFETASEFALLLEECLAHVQQPSMSPLPKRLIPQTSDRFIFLSTRKGFWTMLGSLGIFLMGMLLWSGTQPPDIGGKWTSDEWGTVELKEKEPGRYEGKIENGLFVFGLAPFDHEQWTHMACANCHKGQNDFAGKIELKWSRVENRFNGNWSIPANHSGKLSIRLVENEIRGGWTTSKKSDPHPGTPRLGDLTWKRVSNGADATANLDEEKSSKLDGRMELDGSSFSFYLPEDRSQDHVKSRPKWLADLHLDTAGGQLAFAVKRFNEQINQKYPNHTQPPLTTDELMACASWNLLHKQNSVQVSGLLTALVHRYQLLDGWDLAGEYVELPPTEMPVRAFRITLQHRTSGDRFTIRQRFIAPVQELPRTTTDTTDGMISLSAAIKRFNETNFRVDNKKQPPLTEEEVVAAILNEQTRRDNHDVSDSLFERFQDIARTRYLPKDAAIEVISSFGGGGKRDPVHTIWSVRIRLTQDESGREGWTWAFFIREHFISVKQPDAERIYWGTPGTNGLQLGMRLSSPANRYLMGQKIDVELVYRNALTKSIDATIPTFPSYAIELNDENGMRRRTLESGEKPPGGVRLETIGEQPVSLRGSPIVLAPSSLGPEEEAQLLSAMQGANLVFVKPGQSYRLKLTARNIASDAIGELLSTSEFDFAVEASPDAVSAEQKTAR